MLDASSLRFDDLRIKHIGTYKIANVLGASKDGRMQKRRRQPRMDAKSPRTTASRGNKSLLGRRPYGAWRGVGDERMRSDRL